MWWHIKVMKSGNRYSVFSLSATYCSERSGIASVNHALWRASQAPVSLLIIVLLPKYMPHDTQNPKILQRYRIRFISICSSALPMSFVSMIIQIVRQCCPPMGFFLCKVSASGILQGSATSLISRFFQKFLGQVCLHPKSFKPITGWNNLGYPLHPDAFSLHSLSQCKKSSQGGLHF